MLQRTIPSSNESLPIIGLGTWQVFDVASQADLQPLKEVLNTLSEGGGKMIDSSPMYGRSEEVVGRLTTETADPNAFLYATKVWIQGRKEGVAQMENSFRKMNRTVMDLMQIHNLVDWKTHLKTLRTWKEEGKIRYIGITHYTDSMHSELEQIISTEQIDFVQFNYSIINRNAEKRLLPLAADRGVATIINRPLGEGNLFAKTKGKLLPEWATAQGIESWSQFFLKFIATHPAVTCIIPATAQPLHAADNLRAGEGTLPDEILRNKMAALIASF